MADKYKLFITLIVSIIGSFIDSNFETFFPLKRLLIHMSFFYMGIYIAKYPETKMMSKSALVIYFTGSIISSASCFILGYRLFSIKILGIISAACLSMFAIYLFKNIHFLKDLRILNICGKYSLEIYVMHNFITAANRIILFKAGIVNFYLNILVNLIMAVGIPILFAVILKKINIHKVVFRPFTFIYEKKKAHNIL